MPYPTRSLPKRRSGTASLAGSLRSKSRQRRQQDNPEWGWRQMDKSIQVITIMAAIYRILAVCHALC